MNTLIANSLCIATGLALLTAIVISIVRVVNAVTKLINAINELKAAWKKFFAKK